MKTRTDDTWKDPEMAKLFLAEVVGAIPLEAEQLDVMLRLIGYERDNVKSVLDIGCGNGIVASVILNRYPEAQATLLDFSDVMLDAAREKMGEYGEQVRYLMSDYGDEKINAQMSGESDCFDVIVSRFSIHHQTDKRKKELYREIFDMLNPGGIFINIEHVASVSNWATLMFEDYVTDHLYAAQKKKENPKSRQQISEEFHERHDKDANIVSPVEQQCDWLREIGFADADCYFKVFEMAIFGGRRK